MTSQETPEVRIVDEDESSKQDVIDVDQGEVRDVDEDDKQDVTEVEMIDQGEDEDKDEHRARCQEDSEEKAEKPDNEEEELEKKSEKETDKRSEDQVDELAQEQDDKVIPEGIVPTADAATMVDEEQRLEKDKAATGRGSKSQPSNEQHEEEPPKKIHKARTSQAAGDNAKDQSKSITSETRAPVARPLLSKTGTTLDNADAILALEKQMDLRMAVDDFQGARAMRTRIDLEKKKFECILARDLDEAERVHNEIERYKATEKMALSPEEAASSEARAQMPSDSMRTRKRSPFDESHEDEPHQKNMKSNTDRRATSTPAISEQSPRKDGQVATADAKAKMMREAIAQEFQEVIEFQETIAQSVADLQKKKFDAVEADQYEQAATLHSTLQKRLTRQKTLEQLIRENNFSDALKLKSTIKSEMGDPTDDKQTSRSAGYKVTMKHKADLEKRREEAAQQHDFAQANDLHKEIQEIEKRIAAGDFGSAAARRGITAGDSREVVNEYETDQVMAIAYQTAIKRSLEKIDKQIADAVKICDYTEAGTLHGTRLKSRFALEETTRLIHLGQHASVLAFKRKQDNAGQDIEEQDNAGQDVADKKTSIEECVKPYEFQATIHDRIQTTKRELDDAVKKNDFLNAQTINNKLDTQKTLYEKVRRLLADGDLDSAAALEQQTREEAPTKPAVQAGRSDATDVDRSRLVADLYRTDIPMLTKVNLKDVRVLSVSRIGTVVGKGKGQQKGKQQKGKDKGQQKGKGKDKDKQKGKGQEKGQPDRQDSKVAYIGQEGCIVCVAAFGTDMVRSISDDLVGHSVDIKALHVRPGQSGIVYCEDDTRISKRLEMHDATTPYRFPYDVSTVNKDLATKNYIQTCAVGDLVSLVIYVRSCEAKFTYNLGDAYLEVHGIDMDGNPSGALRMWRHEDGDMQAGNVYILRGLRVDSEKWWSVEEAKYVL